MIKRILYPAIICFLFCGCGTKGKIKTIRNDMASAQVLLPVEKETNKFEFDNEEASASDTIIVTDLNGKPVIFMNAVRDEETGEMVASESIRAAMVTARFRNIAERNGEVEISFDIIIPKQLQDDRWQIRFTPFLKIGKDTTTLDEVRITGKGYRESQLKGYEQYNKYIASIITSEDDLTYVDLLKVFIERNIPDLAKLEKDSSAISESLMEGYYGVTYSQVKEYYTKIIKTKINERKKRNKEKVFKRYVKDPWTVTGIRVDSVINNVSEITYHYTQVIKTRPDLKKIEMTLEGSICMNGEELYRMPESKPLSFYISSLSTFTEDKIVYLKKVIERRVQANTAAFISFKTGKYDIIDTLRDNKNEIKRIEKNIQDILKNQEFDLDSVKVTASCSPEGGYENNAMLARERGLSIKNYFSEVIYRYKNNVENEKAGMMINYTPEDNETPFESTDEDIDIKIITKYIAEEWDYLNMLISHDTIIKEKEKLLECFRILNLDQRENVLKRSAYYQYIKEKLYPKLRCVRFDFFLHRKGMVRDTVHTTEIDTVYQKGLLYLKERNYEQALTYLKPYSDFNTAIALTSMGYNSSALSILENLPHDAKRDYILAILYSRKGDDSKAVQCYMYSLSHDRSMVHRGNLDPEISRLIKKYNINNE